MSEEDWAPEKRDLKKQLTVQLESCGLRIRSAASCSSDPKCAELAREYRKIEEFLKMLDPKENKDAKRTGD
jgi:hypothetical protein